MRLAGALTALASVMAAAIFALLPTSVPLLGDSCGPPIGRLVARMTDSEWQSQEFAKVCYEQSMPRIYIAGVLLLMGVGGGATLIAVGWPEPSVRRERMSA